MSLTLGEKQRLLGKLLPKLLYRIHDLGFEVAIGEAERPQVTADYYASVGKGSKRSLHRLRLAIDLHLFRDGVYLDKTEDHAQLGSFWESLHPLCVWGGHFGDGNHYGITHEGVK